MKSFEIPIFRLSFLSFTVERAVATRLIDRYEGSCSLLGLLLALLSLSIAWTLSFSYNLREFPLVGECSCFLNSARCA